MKTQTKKLLIPIMRRKSHKLFLNSIKNENTKTDYLAYKKKYDNFCEKVKLEIAYLLLAKMGYKNIILDPISSNTNSIVGNISFIATPKRSINARKVVVLISKYEVFSIVEQKNNKRKFSWLSNGQAYENSKNIAIA